MCGLCGIFQGADHWTDGSNAHSPEAARTRRHDRLRRAAITNKVLKFYGLKLNDWNGGSYVLSNQTGQSQIIDNIAALWPAAEALRKRPLDPLDNSLLEALERA
jgi:ATP-dependent exoDNAse (exonuclease V) beta subunit